MGSTTSLRRSRQSSTARESDCSDTVTTSSTSDATWAKLTGPGSPTAMPSAMVDVWLSRTGAPATSDGGYAAASSAWTPMTLTSGRTALTAEATPPTSPPPPVATRIVLTPGTCSRISSPTVPW